MSNELILAGESAIANADLYTSKVVSNDFGQGDLTYSWLKIAQSTTEQVKKMSTSRIEGLEEGMFFDSLTSRVFGNSVKVCFLQFFHSFREQKPGARGEFVRVIPKDEFEHLKATKDCEWVDKIGWSLQNGNVVKESWNYMVLLPEHLDLGPMRLAFGPGAKKYLNAWNTQIKMARLPNGQPAAPFSVVWELSLGLDTGSSGDTFYTVGSNGKALVKKLGLIGNVDVLTEAKASYEFFQSLGASAVVEAKSASEEFDTGPL